ncbi:hypothetical protein JKG47_10350 [Acidithiobacillus sp. MC6.1]|nr:hypothetical protein [Acidithiobacillus sp. MC6.1]
MPARSCRKSGPCAPAQDERQNAITSSGVMLIQGLPKNPIIFSGYNHAVSFIIREGILLRPSQGCSRGFMLYCHGLRVLPKRGEPQLSGVQVYPAGQGGGGGGGAG